MSNRVLRCCSYHSITTLHDRNCLVRSEMAKEIFLPPTTTFVSVSAKVHKSSLCSEHLRPNWHHKLIKLTMFRLKLKIKQSKLHSNFMNLHLYWHIVTIKWNIIIVSPPSTEWVHKRRGRSSRGAPIRKMFDWCCWSLTTPIAPFRQTSKTPSLNFLSPERVLKCKRQ